MKGKILFLAGVGVGYVLGTRAGRERYEQIKAAAARFWNAPVVQHRVDDVQEFVKDKAPEVAGFVAEGAKKVVAQVAGRGSGAKSATSAAKKPAPKSSRSSTTRKSASDSDS